MRMCVVVPCLCLNKALHRFGVVIVVFYHQLLSFMKGGQLSVFKVLDEPLSWTWVYLLILHVPTCLYFSLSFSLFLLTQSRLSLCAWPSLYLALSLFLFVFFPPVTQGWITNTADVSSLQYVRALVFPGHWIGLRGAGAWKRVLYLWFMSAICFIKLLWPSLTSVYLVLCSDSKSARTITETVQKLI